ncbi:lysine 2,3-aminomutase YodO family protein [Thermosipho africanus H17ap60334]|jgi:lysine 2,3-aminomutase|uniref:L-lysine 2,3-aminomutase n=1 Tax=Thermosipho africanus (strain TCF52B) TaxID=484019 RepID=B7IFQ3_THEAB|nr:MULTISPECIES: lysine 2,3-aminomutase [Thermosipho]HCF37493.1 lysine 2,3-aminomutase [Thermosipho africanus]ACJ74917.1 L-lysine 2,3-aminomutase [Thermosipho africanus TCF52B]EKF48653.1 lysine 2,3-aminomutase YodO family protein [Thermosipho africanus H17ap60334]MBZ4649438.1 L-lysine 2,3-aminomutase [Thermosipho sp. (in: thermotogales)]MDK2839156.1 lysine 2,3-aminomutase [Thermosipho sp. (in: thermotogales)]
MRNYKEIPLWKNVSEEEWNDWKWQIRNRITDVDTLKQVINLTPEEENGIRNSLKTLRMAITPYYASLMDPDNPKCPIRRQAVPTIKELEVKPWDMVDPLHEDEDSPVPGLTHRYPDRVLLLVTDMCAMYCRHCTRRRFAGQHDRARTKQEIDAAIEYIRETPQVRDVLLSGGDALLAGIDMLEYILKELRKIKHVEIIRIGSRAPVVIPQIVTKELTDMLKKYHPIWLNTHFNHPKEITPESSRACEMLADAGIPLGNQSVLLRGVNDSPYIMMELVHQLVKIRVRPYYLYQCDLSQGISHFRTSIGTGLRIIESLIGHTSGFCVPTYVVDAPAGGGKIRLMPEYLISYSDKTAILRNYEGVIVAYHEPEDTESDVDDSEYREKYKLSGIASLYDSKKISMEPAHLERHERIRKWKEKRGEKK